jgi:Ca2+-binding RTX toxin-like protein
MADITGTPGDDTLIGTAEDDFIVGLEGNDTIIGLEGNDQLLGNEDSDTIDGGEGHDFLAGGDGNDQLFGGADDDFLRGDLGDDVLDGGTGINRVSYAVGAVGGVTVSLLLQGANQNTGSAGIDTLFNIHHLSGTIFDDTLIGDGGDNWIWGGSDGSGTTGNDTIDAGGGNDLVWVGTGAHTIAGAIGDDTLSFFANQTDVTSAGVTVSLALQGATQDTEQGLMFITGFENLSGSIHDDSLAGDGNANVLLGDIGSDSLFGGDGDDTLYGDGRTTVDTHDTGTSGPIVTYADVSLLPFAGAPGDDILEGGDGDDTLEGGGGSDYAAYTLASGEVTVLLDLGVASGAAGDDSLVSIENFLGSAFNDFARGTTGDNVLAGLGGHDLLRGLDGNDILKGGDGDDYLEGGPGDDTIDGGSGLDRIAFRIGVTTGATVDLNIQGVGQATGHGMDTLIDIEHASGTVFTDTLTGNAGDNWLWGESGSDILSGGGGNDLVQVGAGATTAAGGTGSDTLSFGGDELISLIDSDGVTVSLLLQGAAQDTEQGLMILSGFENLSGSNFDDHLTGDDNDNILAGDSGADTLVGGRGNDILLGDGRVGIDSHGAGTSGPIVTYDDVSLLPFGLAAGNDTLDGGRGNDVLNGGGGDDELTGGQDLDTFVFGEASGDDVVTDFRNGQDLIRFDGIAGVDDFSDLTIVRFRSGSLISWGDGSNTIFVEHVRPAELDAGDFQFI